MPEIPTLDPRAARVNLQDLQAAHRPIPHHDEAICEGLARARRPEVVTHLLSRAAVKLRPTSPNPEARDE